MIKPNRLKKGDKVAIVSLSSGILGEDYCKHQLKLGIQRLNEFGLEPVFMKNSLKGVEYLYNNPKARAEDLLEAFQSPEIKAVISAIGGDETYKILPYLFEDEEFKKAIKENPKIFMGYSDTTNNHLMFYKLGLVTYYGPAFLTDFTELDKNMLKYTENAIKTLFTPKNQIFIESSTTWFMDREDFSENELNKSRILKIESKNYEVIYGSGKIYGKLLGGCLESLYDGYTGDRYIEQKAIYEKYNLMPGISEWKNKIMFIETSDENINPKEFKKYLKTFADLGILSAISGLLVGKPIDEVYYHEYKSILSKFAQKHNLSILYNLNFGHSYPRTIIPYGVNVEL